LEDRNKSTQIDRDHLINQTVRTARAVVQHYNAETHITVQHCRLL